MDADERLKTYGMNGLRNEGDEVSRPDGVVELSRVVDAIEAIPDGESRSVRQTPLIELYQDRPRLDLVGVSSVDRQPEMEALYMRLSAVLPTSVVERLRTNLAANRKARISGALSVVGDKWEPTDVRLAVDWEDYPAGVIVPQGYKLRRDGIYRVKASKDKLLEIKIGSVLLITRTLVDADDATWSVELAWWHRGRWRTQVVPRSTALDSRALVRLTDDGLPVSSSSARHLVEWLTQLDQQEAMPRDWCSARCGWVGHKSLYYLLGEKQMHAGDDAEHRVNLATESPGALQLARAIHTKGTWEGWLGVVDVISDEPRAWLALYAACAAPLLRLLGAPNFGIDLCGQSGRGKSTILELAVSAFGSPAPGGAYRAWSATMAGAEGTVGTLCDHLLCLDEGQLVPPQRWNDAGALLFAIISGASRAKGALGRMALAQVDTWRTVLLSTSEVGITSWSPDDGVRRRVIEIRGDALPTAEMSIQVRDIIADHYGHLYARLVQHLVSIDDDQRARLKRAWQETRDQLSAESSAGHARSMAAYVATLDCAAMLMHDVLGVPRPGVDVMGWIWQQVLSVSGEADRARRALDVALSWCWGNEGDFQDGERVKPRSGAWVGIWERRNEYVAVRPEVLSRVLAQAGLGSPESLYREWAARGWTVTDAGRTRLKVREPGQMTLGEARKRRMIAIKVEK